MKSWQWHHNITMWTVIFQPLHVPPWPSQILAKSIQRPAPLRIWPLVLTVLLPAELVSNCKDLHSGEIFNILKFLYNFFYYLIDNVKERGLGVAEGLWPDVLVIISLFLHSFVRYLVKIITLVKSRHGATDNCVSGQHNSQERRQASLRLSGVGRACDER